MKALQTSCRFSVAIAVPVVFACSGSMSAPLPSDDAGDGNGIPGTGVGAGTTPGAIVDITRDPSLGTALPPESAGPLVLRRLSPREYSNTLRDLLGDTADPGAVLPDEGNRETGFAIYESASVASVKTFLETAERLVAEGRIAVPPCAEGEEEQTCAASFIDQFGRRVFRRPVMSSEAQNLTALFSTAREIGFNYSESVGHVATAMLQSSGFLYLWEIGDAAPVAEAGLVALTPHQVASRLSYSIWGTTPDAELSAAADAGWLSTPEQVAAQAARLFENDERVSATMADFHLQWLHIDNLDDLQKDPTRYPVFDDEVRRGFKAELEGFVADVLVKGDGTTRSLLTASHSVYTTDGIASIYGVAPEADAQNRLALDSSERSGLFTLAGLLASTANTDGSNPPRRGKLLWTELLCGYVPPPPADIPPVAAPTESLTTRERFERHTGDPCAGACHTILDPLGFAFENYDGVGAFRAQENGFDVDASGTLRTPAGGIIEFENAVDLMRTLASSYEVDRCIGEKWFVYMLGRASLEADKPSFETAYRAAGAGLQRISRSRSLSVER